MQQSASAAAGMREQAATLVNVVSAFRIATDGAAATNTAAAPPQRERTERLAAAKPAIALAKVGDDWEEF